MADVKVATNAAGDYAVGVEIDGVFVPLAQITAVRVQHVTERHADLTEKAEAGGEEAKAQLDAEWYTGSKPKASSTSEGASK